MRIYTFHILFKTDPKKNSINFFTLKLFISPLFSSSGLDSYSCTNMIAYLKQLAQQGRTVICTIHQPSAKLFEKFDLVYILAYGKCLYQGHSSKLVPFLQSVSLPCPKFHNPADYGKLYCNGYVMCNFFIKKNVYLLFSHRISIW